MFTYPQSLVTVILAALIALTPAHAAKEIGWEDLDPNEETDFVDPFATLTDDQLISLSLVAQYRELKEIQESLSEAGQAELDAELLRLEEWGIDVDGLLAKRDEIIAFRMKQAFQTNPDLDGASVRLPGYLLPLEYSEELVTEFLLVPWIGACIHTPPPPPNQIVLVSSEAGFKFTDIFIPVWIEGTMETEPLSANLSFVDGSADIPVAYTMNADNILPYE